MGPFLKKYDLKNLITLGVLRLQIARAHSLVQKLEGGVKATRQAKYLATNAFLQILAGDSRIEHPPMLTERELVEVLDDAFPKFHCDMQRAETAGEVPVWMVGVREGGHDDKPLANGYAVCSNPTVALMQAVLRMLDNLVAQVQVERLRARELQAGHRLAGKSHPEFYWLDLDSPGKTIDGRRKIEPVIVGVDTGRDPPTMVFSTTVPPGKPSPL